MAQKTRARHIEFSEPLQPSPATNVQDIRADRSSLSELEERLSKTFDFFDIHNSLGGAPAPKLHPVRVITKDRKASGDLDEESDWGLGSDSNSADILSQVEAIKEGKQSSTKDRPSIPDLTGDDWLVKKDMQDTFWNLPDPSLRDAPTFSRPSDNSRRPSSRRSHPDQLESSAKPDVASAFARAASRSSSTHPWEFALSGPDTRLEMDLWEARNAKAAAKRRSSFRKLLGMPPLAATAASARGLASRDALNFSTHSSDITGWNLDSPTSSVDLSGRYRDRHSLNPVMPRDSGYIMPSLPGLPQTRASNANQDQNEAEQSPSLNRFGNHLLSSPFSEPPKRQF